MHLTDDAANSGAFLSFSGDAEDEAIDLFAEAQKAVDEIDSAAQQEEEEEDDEAEPEDDFNAAWEVLDLARAIYEKQDQSDEVKLKLAEVFVTLGDVSLETGASCDFAEKGAWIECIPPHRKVRPSDHRLHRRPRSED